VIVTWAFWLTRITVLMAALAGSSTGFVATALTWDSILLMEYRTSLMLATIIGALGGGAGAGLQWRKYRRERASDASNIASTWRYSLRELFFRFMIVTAVIASWTLAVNAYRTAEHVADGVGFIDD